MPANPKSVDALSREIRACFARLRAIGDALHRDLGVTAAQRAVIEFLFENGDHTVPQIARAKSVTRQHIQTLVDVLAPMGLVALRDNPSHKRSPLVALTGQGQRTFDAMRAREAVVIDDIAGRLNEGELQVTLSTLGRFRSELQNRPQTGDDDD